MFDVFEQDAVVFIDGIDVVEEQSQDFFGHALLLTQLVAEPLRRAIQSIPNQSSKTIIFLQINNEINSNQSSGNFKLPSR